MDNNSIVVKPVFVNAYNALGIVSKVNASLIVYYDQVTNKATNEPFVDLTLLKIRYLNGEETIHWFDDAGLKAFDALTQE